MKKSVSNHYIYDTTIPYLDFNITEYTNELTIIGHVFAGYLEEIDRFLFYLRAAHHCFEPVKDSVINDFQSQIKQAKISDKDNAYWEKHFQEIFSWNIQEKFISVLIFTRLVNLYTIYLTEMANFIISRTYPNLVSERKNLLRNFQNLKKCFRDYFDIPLYSTPKDEHLADQLVILRNLLVHSMGIIPDEYLTKFYNWKELECIKQDSDLLAIEFTFPCLHTFGNFLSKSIADIDNRVSEKFGFESYLFEGKIPDEDIPQTDFIDEDFYNDEE